MRPLTKDLQEKVVAAAELFAERGLDGTKTDDIVAVTGIPKATLYYYFEGKEDILSYIYKVAIDATEAAVLAAARGPGTAAERLERVVHAHLGVFAELPKASQALNFDIGRAVRLPEMVERTRSSYLDPVSALLEEGAEDGSLREVPYPALTALAILGATTVAAVHVLAVEASGSLDQLRDVIAPVVLDGLRSGR